MSRLTERGEHVFNGITATGRAVVGALTDAARFVFGVTAGTTYEKSGNGTADLEAGGLATRKRRRKRLLFLPVTMERPPFEWNVNVVTKSGGASQQSLASGTRRLEKHRTGSAVAVLHASGLAVSAYEESEWIELLITGALTLDDLLAMDDIPDHILDEALILA